MPVLFGTLSHSVVPGSDTPGGLVSGVSIPRRYVRRVKHVCSQNAMADASWRRSVQKDKGDAVYDETKLTSSLGGLSGWRNSHTPHLLQRGSPLCLPP